MVRARLQRAAALPVASLLLVLSAATGVHSACNATCELELARRMAKQCDGTLTDDAAGVATNPDGSFRVELPGPFAYSGGRH